MRSTLLLTELLLLVTCVFSDPIIIKSGISRDHSQHHGGGLLDLSSKKGVSSFETDLGFNKDNERKHVGAQDFGKYGTELDDKKHYVDEKDFANENFRRLGGSGVENFGNKETHKKGHEKSGFHNTYHKDESGSKSSYHDNSNDEGGQYRHNNREGNFGDSGLNRYQGSFLDGSKYAKNDAKYGGYNNEGAYEKDFGNKRNYNQEKYYDDRALQGNSNAGNQFGEAGRYVEEQYHKPYHVYERPFYPQPQYYETSRFEPRKTITVYEDPRVYNRNMGYSSHERYPNYNHHDVNMGYSSHEHYPNHEENIHLDVRRPVQFPAQKNYYNDRSYYDDADDRYYY